MKNKLHTKKRTYFFNVYENDDQNILEIVESSINKNGTKKRNKIIIFLQDLSDVIDKIKETVKNGNEQDWWLTYILNFFFLNICTLL